MSDGNSNLHRNLSSKGMANQTKIPRRPDTYISVSIYGANTSGAKEKIKATNRRVTNNGLSFDMATLTSSCKDDNNNNNSTMRLFGVSEGLATLFRTLQFYTASPYIQHK